ncbi:MAG: dihydrodipicolinate synthase family protein, partial [Actinomycetes bacterium]
MNRNPFGQVLVALVTPMGADGEVDWDDVERLIDDVVTHGADGIVVSGTTGE